MSEGLPAAEVVVESEKPEVVHRMTAEELAVLSRAGLFSTQVFEAMEAGESPVGPFEVEVAGNTYMAEIVSEGDTSAFVDPGVEVAGDLKGIDGVAAQLGMSPETLQDIIDKSVSCAVEAAASEIEQQTEIGLDAFGREVEIPVKTACAKAVDEELNRAADKYGLNPSQLLMLMAYANTAVPAADPLAGLGLGDDLFGDVSFDDVDFETGVDVEGAQERALAAERAANAAEATLEILEK